ncbi:hypothetical protein A4A49_10021 [Nicotiana attenuata]|uniref:Uncharacterized protein n=1 Tax=Nicotiana attenuata TaxID=49451 RepID=A0A314LE45_NICAT|nr:hypothetical protein A4A49_10021 [Nicotiana attenuata]
MKFSSDEQQKTTVPNQRKKSLRPKKINSKSAANNHSFDFELFESKFQSNLPKTLVFFLCFVFLEFHSLFLVFRISDVEFQTVSQHFPDVCD